MSKLEIGRTYVTRDGSRVKLRETEEYPAGSANPSTVYLGDYVDATWKPAVRYWPTGMPVYSNNDAMIIDLAGDEVKDADTKSIGLASYARKRAEPGENVLLIDGQEPPEELALTVVKRDEKGRFMSVTKTPALERDDDPVHPQEGDNSGDTVPQSVQETQKQVADALFGKGEETPASEDTTMTPLRAQLVQAVLDGKTVQWRRQDGGDWQDLRNRSFAIRMLMQHDSPYEFRLKAVPLVKFVAIYRDGRVSQSFARYEDVPDAGWGVQHVLSLTIDADTMRVTGYHHLAPRGSKNV